MGNSFYNKKPTSLLRMFAKITTFAAAAVLASAVGVKNGGKKTVKEAILTKMYEKNSTAEGPMPTIRGETSDYSNLMIDYFNTFDDKRLFEVHMNYGWGACFMDIWVNLPEHQYLDWAGLLRYEMSLDEFLWCTEGG